VIGVGAVVMLAVGGVALAKKNRSGSDAVEVRLVVRDMAYFVEGASERNPTLRVPRGARLRLVLTNDDPGYSHNLVVSALAIDMPLLTRGRSQTVDVTVPDAPGVHQYACGPHAQMMRGNIAIE
jgi:plastocyanin